MKMEENFKTKARRHVCSYITEFLWFHQSVKVKTVNIFMNICQQKLISCIQQESNVNDANSLNRIFWILFHTCFIRDNLFSGVKSFSSKNCQLIILFLRYTDNIWNKYYRVIQIQGSLKTNTICVKQNRSPSLFIIV